MTKKRLNNNKIVYSFTLVELMIVIVILAILAGIVYLILRPNKTITKAQDTQRVYDLRHITEYISTAELGKVVGIFNYGSPNIVYVSLPDTSATCASYTLPTLPPGYTYHCSTQENYKKPDGTGWIPIIFEGDLTGYSISSLPVDPVNQPPYYYTYFPSSSYELTALLSEPNSNSINDNGLGTQTYETGTPGISTHTPIIREPSLVGYWPFNEGDGSYAYDYSGHNNTGTLTNGPIWTTLSTNEKVLSFDGSDDWVNYGSTKIVNENSNFTIILWYYHKDVGPDGFCSIFGNTVSASRLYWAFNIILSSNNIHGQVGNSTTVASTSSYGISTGNWYYIYLIWNKPYLSFYVNNNLVQSKEISLSGNVPGYYTTFKNISGAGYEGGYYFMNGYLDDVRIYNRALSQGEIQYLYTKTQARYK